MKKPQKKTRTYYSYNECRDYLQEKFGYDERDFKGKFKNPKRMNEDVPYLDFWHWVVARFEISNGCFITFAEDELEYIVEDWIKEIYQHYIDEFAEGGELDMWVEW